jgi:predicted RNase H-like HicB family nuclease
MRKEFNVIIEKDSEGFFIGSVPSLKGCHTQAKSLDELMERIKEAIELCLEVEGEDEINSFVALIFLLIYDKNSKINWLNLLKFGKQSF